MPAPAGLAFLEPGASLVLAATLCLLVWADDTRFHFALTRGRLLLRQGALEPVRPIPLRDIASIEVMNVRTTKRAAHRAAGDLLLVLGHGTVVVRSLDDVHAVAAAIVRARDAAEGS